MNVHVELGCGNNLRALEGWKNIGIDIVSSPCTMHLCNLGFEPIPLADSSVELVQAMDLLEHIPKCVWISGKKRIASGDIVSTEDFVRLTPFISLMNEVYRILNPGGRLVAETPFTDWAFDRDPTHVTKLSDDWSHYFSKHDNLYYDQGLVTCDFVCTKKTRVNDGNTLLVELVAVKPIYSEPVI